MSLKDLIKPSLWQRCSKKVGERIENARNVGFFTKDDAEQRGMHFTAAEVGKLHEGEDLLALFWLVDPSDGIVVDARFQVFGPPPLIAAAEAACELLIGKNHDQTRRITADLLDMQLRDKSELPAFPEECSIYLNLVLETIDRCADQCRELPLPTNYQTPVPQHVEDGGEGYPGWLELPYKEKLRVIETVLDADVRPYVELDEGGIELVDLRNNKEVIIAYQGTCTSCLSAVGATLSTIQQIVRSKVHHELVVVPNLDELEF